MVNVIKADNKIEPYSQEKLLNSLRRARVPMDIEESVLSHINSKVYENIPTNEIFGHVGSYLNSSKYPFSRSLYHLKQAVMELGPTGYPFEDFIAEVLNESGYNTKVRQVLTGNCVSHEIDIIASNSQEQILVEAKFHNSNAIKTDVHVALYTKARYDDLRQKYDFGQCWVVTNTKATADAIMYSSCAGIKLISWNYPDGQGLRDIIEQAKLHPVTMISSLTRENKMKLLENHIVRCKMIHDNPSVLDVLGLDDARKQAVMDELGYICKGEHNNNS